MTSSSLFLSDEHRAQLRSLPSDLRGFAFGMLMNYLFRGTQQADIRTAFESRGIGQDVFDFRGWRLRLPRSGSLLREGKLYLYSRASKDFQPLTPKALGLSRQDVNLLELALDQAPLRRSLRAFAKSGFESLGPSNLEQFLIAVLQSPDLRGFMRHLIRTQASFLVQSYNVLPTHLMSDFKAQALYALLKAYPKYDDVGHGLAIAKTAIHNRCINIIKELTAKKRNQLQQRPDGSYERTTVALHLMADGTGSFLSQDDSVTAQSSLLVVGIDGLSESDRLPWDTMHSLRQLCNSPNLKERQRRLLFLLSGNHSEEFSSYLGEPNDQACVRMDFAKYFSAVCGYLNITETGATRFLTGLRSAL